MKVKISSLGCRLNTSEMESVATDLRQRGHHITENNDADIFIVNSCVVTLQSERKTRKLIYHSLRDLQACDGRLIIVTGCFTDVVSLSDDGVLLYIPNDYKYLIPDIIDNPDIIRSIDRYSPSRFAYSPAIRASRTRINLKIQDGCDNFCSYCIIPYTRGRTKSKPFQQVISEFDSLINAGYKEILLSGVMIGNYTSSDMDLPGLIRALLARPGTFRIHLSSLSPDYATPELLELLGDKKMVQHLHLSLQSGSDRILQLMNRHYTARYYLSLIEKIRKEIPLYNFTTDVIVGFPGETRADFLQTRDCVRDAGFSHVHTFRYSSRPGTAAAQLRNTVDEAEKNWRSGEIIKLFLQQKRDYYNRFHNIETTFLSERYKNGRTGGFNEYYVPVEIEERLERNRYFSITTRLNKDGTALSGKVDHAL